LEGSWKAKGNEATKKVRNDRMVAFEKVAHNWEDIEDLADLGNLAGKDSAFSEWRYRNGHGGS
jgi:hypothetical protein